MIFLLSLLLTHLPFVLPTPSLHESFFKGGSKADKSVV